MNELSKERAIEALYTVRAYYTSLTAGYPEGKDCRGIGDVMCSEIANSCLMAIKVLEQQPCEDCISRQAVLRCIKESREGIDWGQSEDEDAFLHYTAALYRTIASKECLPPVTPKFTDEEIQKMQELEQAQLEKAYELGMQTSFEEWLNSFNTDSATECFTAIQQLKEKTKEG